MRRLAIVPIVVGATVAALVASLVMPSPSSEAFWSASTSGGSSAAQATTVQQVGTPTATVASRNDVTVSWPATTLADGTAVGGYLVTRTNADTGTSFAATGGCANVGTATTCLEAAVPDGRWTYAIVARFATSWTGPSSASSAVAIADTVPPTNALSIDVTSGRAVLVGSTVWFRGAGNGSLRIVNALTDDLSGPAQSVTGMLTGDTSGWSHTAGPVSTATDGRYFSNPVAWGPGTTGTPTLGISGIDRAGNTAASTLTFANDNTAPTGGAISYASGTVRTSSATASTGAVSVSVGAVADLNGSGVATRVLERRTAPLTGDACGSTYGSWAAIATFGDNRAQTVSDAAPVGTCVQYRYVVTDAVANTLESTGTNVVKVKPPYQGLVSGTSGVVGQYTFDSANVLRNSIGTNGSTTSMDTRPTATSDSPIAGDGGSSAFFDGSNDFIRTQRTIQDSFTIEFWFRSDNGGKGAGSNWYNGAGLVDAEWPGVANDFGIALMADGRVIAGVGRPGVGDVNIASQAGLANNAWHHVVMTRSNATGIVELWIDGRSVGTVTGGTQSLNSSASIDFGRLQTNIAGQYYRGNLDEIAIYDRVLTNAEIQSHYANAR
ncbi:LamG domain-containing protein [Agrococcus jejuensis]|uniref:Concanavalin A-like lectin/glucanases superfamily protein n=1 Tax=Agrococcus jejuensis TaxID=399736 RepID=A0A1G7ZMK7_9MICO|nr:LamG domain-containing protein [Agrococcus jejuensis]SDH09879.1 Concanavalin A-like lectin/glucanases superfamily protein [Agrococcus jejuensis]